MFTIKDIARIERDALNLLYDISELLENCELDTTVDYEKFRDLNASFLCFAREDITTGLSYIERTKKRMKQSD